MRLDYSRSFSIHWDTHYDGLEHQHSIAGGIHMTTFVLSCGYEIVWRKLSIESGFCTMQRKDLHM